MSILLLGGCHAWTGRLRGRKQAGMSAGLAVRGGRARVAAQRAEATRICTATRSSRAQSRKAPRLPKKSSYRTRKQHQLPRKHLPEKSARSSPVAASPDWEDASMVREAGSSGNSLGFSGSRLSFPGTELLGCGRVSLWLRFSSESSVRFFQGVTPSAKRHGSRWRSMPSRTL